MRHFKMFSSEKLISSPTWIVSGNEVFENDLVGLLSDLIAKRHLSDLPALVVIVNEWLGPQWKSNCRQSLRGVFDVNVEVTGRACILVVEELKTLFGVWLNLVCYQIAL